MYFFFFFFSNQDNLKMREGGIGSLEHIWFALNFHNSEKREMLN